MLLNLFFVFVPLSAGHIIRLKPKLSLEGA